MQNDRRVRFRKHSTNDVSNNRPAQLNGTDIYIQKYDMTGKGYKQDKNNNLKIHQQPLQPGQKTTVTIETNHNISYAIEQNKESGHTTFKITVLGGSPDLKRRHDDDDNDDKNEESEENDNEMEGVTLKRIRKSEVEINEDCSSQQNQFLNDYTTRYGRKIQSSNSSDENNNKEYYCPYKKCNETRTTCKDIIKHIQKKHDSSIEMPLKGAWLQYYGYMNEGKWINFDVMSRNTLNVNAKLSVSKYDRLKEMKKKGEPLYFCPYKNCKTIVPNRLGNLYLHIRKKHFKDLMSRRRRGSIFYTCHGEIIDFEKESSCDMVNQGEPILDAFYKDITRFYCPYTGCTVEGFISREGVFKHVKKYHDSKFNIPSDSDCEYTFKHPRSRRTMAFDDASSRQTLEDQQHIILVVKDQEGRSSASRTTRSQPVNIK